MKAEKSLGSPELSFDQSVVPLSFHPAVRSSRPMHLQLRVGAVPVGAGPAGDAG